MNDSIFVGLDVHKATVTIAVAEAGRKGKVRHLGTVPNRADRIAQLAAKLSQAERRLSFCYEAGPCGYGLYRQLKGLGHDWHRGGALADPGEAWRPGEDRSA